MTDIERIWKERDYLYFNERRDAWYYQITRQDLQKKGLTLAEFLKPAHDSLSADANFRLLRDRRPLVLERIRTLRAEVADRVCDPKRLRDLLE